jgi:hypothetical protein
MFDAEQTMFAQLIGIKRGCYFHWSAAGTCPPRIVLSESPELCGGLPKNPIATLLAISISYPEGEVTWIVFGFP